MMGNCLTKIKNTAMEEEGEEEGVKDLIDMTIRKMDYDKDGRISHQECSGFIFLVTWKNEYLAEQRGFQMTCCKNIDISPGCSSDVKRQ